METSVEQLIKDKTFDSLTGEELVLVQELCETEEEFLSMKQFFLELEGVSAVQKSVVSPDIKSSLDSIFGAKHPGIRANWTAPEVAVAVAEPRIIPMYQRTWFRVACILVLIGGTIPFWNLVQTDHEALPELKMAKAEQPALEKFVETDIAEKETAIAVQPTTTSTKAVLVASIDDELVSYSWADSVALVEGDVEGAYRTISKPNFSDEVSAAAPAMFFSAGREADLHPFDGIKTRANALSLAEEPEDLLDLLVPAF